MNIATTIINTPVGDLLAGAVETGICLLDFPYRKMMPQIRERITIATGFRFEEGSHPLLEQLRAELEEYFGGTRKQFTVPLHYCGSGFQQSVWDALLQIPYGETRSYKQQSIALKNEGAIRAIAKANGDNCMMILVPCHRVIGEDGSLTGYAGGLRVKQFLLNLERKVSGKDVQGMLF